MVNVSNNSFLNWFRVVVQKRERFTVPVYQRAYSWIESNITTLIDDLIVDDKERYFLGIFLLNYNKGQNEYDIIDGQQRLITLFILMFLLDKRFESDENDGEISIQGLQIRDILFEQGCLPRILLRNKIDSEYFSKIFDCKTQTEIRNLNKRKDKGSLAIAFKCLCRIVDALSVNECRTILKRIYNASVIVHVENDLGLSMQIFELLNDRGRRLTDLEVIKSFSMHLVWKLAKRTKKKYLTEVEEIFSNIYQYLIEIDECSRRNNCSSVSGDDVLRYFAIVFANWEKKEYSCCRDLLKRELLAKGNDIIEVIECLKMLKSSFEAVKDLYLNIFSSSSIPWLKNLFILNRMASYYPLLIAIYLNYPETRDKVINTSCNLLELFSYRLFSIGERRSDVGEAFFYKLARDVGHSDHLMDPWNIYVKILKQIRDNCSKDRFNFEDGLRDGLYFSKKKSIDSRYLFIKFENYLVEEQKKHLHPGPRGTEKVFISDIKDIMGGSDGKSLTLEHIVPRSCEDVEYLKNICKYSQEWKRQKKTNFSSKFFEENYLNCIGNLVISRHGANSSKSNNYPEFKVWDVFASQEKIKSMIKHSRKTKDADGEDLFVENKDGARKPMKFNLDSIVHRKDDLLKFAHDYWNIDFFDENPKLTKMILKKIELRSPLI